MTQESSDNQMHNGGVAVFVDRDGTLNTNAPSGDYIKRAEDLKLLPATARGLKVLSDAGYTIVVYTNQSGIAKGVMSREDVDAVNARLREELASQGVTVRVIYVCPHVTEDGCDCRKPKPGMLVRAASEIGIDLSRSWAIGDSGRDIEAGHAAGCRTIYVHAHAYPGQREKAEALNPVASVADLAEAARIILDADDR